MNTSVDFFDGIVALSAITLFAKFVTHRTRNDATVSRTMHNLHVVCVLSSVAAVVLALIGLEFEQDPPPLIHLLAAFAVASAVLILVFDGLRDDRTRRRER